MFADHQDYRNFLMLLACAVRRGELVIHAYCLVNTHFHLLAASPTGRLPYTMMRIQNAYVRYRNRRSRLDGSLVRGRFGHRPVLSRRYWLTLLRYIAHNAVEAGLCKHAFEYPYVSARFFVCRGSPPWLDHQAVERRLELPAAPTTGTGRIAALLRMHLADGEARLVERRMKHPRVAEDALDQLFDAPPPYLAQWMSRRIEGAGGASPWTPVAAPRAILEAVHELERTLGAYAVRAGRKHHDGWDLMAAGLLRSLACLTTDASGKHLACHGATASRRIKLHETLMLENANYAKRAGLAARGAIDRTFPRRAESV